MGIEIESLEFSYGNNKVLQDVSFKVNNNDVISILAPNGGGKTTLLKSICRIHAPDSGKIIIGESDACAYNQRDFAKCVSYVPQRAESSFMTVFDSVLLGRRPYIDWEISREDEEMVWDVLRLFSMEALSMKYTNEISGGELQKVQIARALVQNSDVMLLDEPTNNLDLANQHSILGIIRSVVKKSSICAVMIMHDINMALYYSDKFIFLKNGSVKAFGDKNIVMPDIIEDVYGVKSEIVQVNGRPVVVPLKSEFTDTETLDRMGRWMKKNKASQLS